MKQNNNYKYISFATQLTVGLVLSVLIAGWLDKKTGFKISIIFNFITTNSNNNNPY